MATKKTTKKKRAGRKKSPKAVVDLTHEDDKRKNIPTAEYQSVMQESELSDIQIAYERRNQDLDPQLVWRGKDLMDWSDLIVNAPPLYIQEKVHPKALLDDVMRESKERAHEAGELTPDLFADFNGIPKGIDKTEFYQHDANWTNRMILGDGLQVMASLAEREGLRGKVQCIYVDPPYGIKFNSNFQWSTTTRDVKDGKSEHITREPEQVKAFRDTWRDGIHSYLTYLRDRLTVARDLLTDTGSVFVQIGDENVHRVRALLDEIFGEENFVSLILFEKSTGLGAKLLPRNCDYIVWYAKKIESVKYRQLFRDKSIESGSITSFSHLILPNGETRRISKEDIANPRSLPAETRFLRYDNMMKQGPGARYEVVAQGRTFSAGKNWWGLPKESLERLIKLGRAVPQGNTLRAVRYMDDFPAYVMNSTWTDTGSTSSQKTYVVQTETKVVQRCLLMTTDPGDLVLAPRRPRRNPGNPSRNVRHHQPGSFTMGLG